MEPIKSIALFIKFGKVFGCVPLTLSQSGEWVFSKLTMAWSIILVVSYAALVVMDALEKPAKTNAVNKTVNKLQLAGCTVTAFVLLLSPLRYHACMGKALESFCSLDAKIQKAGLRFEYKALKVSICVMLGLVTCFLTYMAVLDYYTKVVNNPTSTTIHWLCIFMPIIFNTFNSCQIAVFTLLLYQRYNKIKELSKTVFVQRGMDKSPRIKTTNADLDAAFNSFKHTLQLLIETGENLNAYYAIQILASIGTGLVILTAQIFYLLVVEMNWKVTLSVSNWIAVHVLQILLTVFGFHYAKYEAEETTRSLGRTRVEKNSEINYKISMLAMRMKISPVDFTACHFFSIDVGLLHSIVASIATYIIILVQFRNADENGGSDDTLAAPDDS